MAFSSNNTISTVAAVGGCRPGVLAIILVSNILGRRVFGSLMELSSPTKNILFQGHLTAMGFASLGERLRSTDVRKCRF